MSSRYPIIDSLREKGWTPADSQHAQLKSQETIKELVTFLDRLPPMAASELEKAAQNRAAAILSKPKQ